MNDIRFSTETTAGFAVSGALMIMLPLVLLIFLKKKLRLRLKPVIVGAIVFPLFALVLKAIPAYPLFLADTKIAAVINGNLWLYYLFGGLLAGIFEETGRFIAYKTVLRTNTERTTAIGYGIGHGGFECMYIGVTMLSLTAMAVTVNSGNLSAITGGMDENTLNTAIAQLKSYSSQTFAATMLGVLERITAMIFHLAMSILVYAAARNKKQSVLYPLAMLLHALLDFSLAFVMLGLINSVLFEILLLTFAVCCLICSVKLIYNKTEDL